ncbi:MAG TPA: ABC transporter ATP-binding protein [Anaerolineales bacterium]|nr:ABC transporter ATP-binding protein [Anaerolineales bacterium]
MLELRNITKSYEGKPLLTDISFTVAEGVTICLLGASGSGKSTILRMIAGLDFPERGAILLNGIDLTLTPPHLRDFGLVFQDYGLFPHLNVFDNIAFGLRMRNILVGEISLRVAALLEQMNLTGFADRKVTDLSGGEQQRVALARALAPSPRLLMFDEPLGALDRSLKEDLLNEIRDILHKTNIPAIYVTHDQEEAFTIADRILVLHEGAIIRDAAPHEIWREPKSAFVAKLLGIGNVVEGEVIAADKIKTRYGTFTLNCSKNIGERLHLLMQQPFAPLGEGRGGEVIAQIQLTVEDILFKQDQFQVKGRGGLIVHMKNAPRIGDVVAVKVQVQCLS